MPLETGALHRQIQNQAWGCPSRAIPSCRCRHSSLDAWSGVLRRQIQNRARSLGVDPGHLERVLSLGVPMVLERAWLQHVRRKLR
eukprot:11776312-Alexandrium_andersonii.AAC.1